MTTLYVGLNGIGAYVLPGVPFRDVTVQTPEPVQASARFCPQTVTILKHLRAIENISGVEAQAIYRCRSLTKRIAELRSDGFGIESVFSKDHTGQRYVRYFLRDDKKHVIT